MKSLRLLFFLLALPVVQSWGAITATLDTPTVAVGDSVQMTVTVTGSQEAPVVPDVDGLNIADVGQSSQVEIINGSITSSSAHTFLLTPQREGSFTVQAVSGNGEKAAPLILKAVKDSAAASAQSAVRSSEPDSSPTQSNPGPTQEEGVAPSGARFGFIRLVLPKRDFYVGELVPAQLKVYVPEGLQASVSGLPTFASEAMAMNQLGGKPLQQEGILGGRRYIVLTWSTALTAIKEGSYAGSITMPLTVVVRERVATSDEDSLLNAFMNDPFFGRGQEKQVEIKSEPITLKVLPLPLPNRPADFHGAVGDFSVETEVSPKQINAGDPMTLQLKVSGSGNFDRVTSDMVKSGEDWKTYSPKNTFVSSDNVGYEGIKTFEQAIIPNNPGAMNIPALSFSYFNPTTQQYVTRTAAPVEVQVTGTARAAVALEPTAAQSSRPGTSPDLRQELVPNKIEEGHFVHSLRPIFLTKWFVSLQLVPVLALLGGWISVRRRQRLIDDPRLLRENKLKGVLQAELQLMDQAISQQQAEAFFLSARRALQQRLGENWQVQPESITLSEVADRLGSEGEGIRPFFTMADQASYSGQEIGESDLRNWKERLLGQLKQMEKRS